MGSTNAGSYWCAAFAPEIAEGLNDMNSGGGPASTIFFIQFMLETCVVKIVLLFVCYLVGGVVIR